MLRCYAPAKLNLFLQVTGKRPDGYHTLRTLFQYIDIKDVLEFTYIGQSNKVQFSVELGYPTISLPPENNLVLTAAKLLRSATGCKGGIAIHLTKNIPVGAGMGGGSSDAATTLVALNQLWGNPLDQTELLALGLQLGADVPFFLFGHTALGRGIGERLRKVKRSGEHWYVLLVPEVTVSTRSMFELLDQKNGTKTDFFVKGGALKSAVWNTFEPLVREQFAAVEAAFCSLAAYAVPRLTGTGGAVFAEFRQKELAEAVLKAVAPSGVAFLAKGVEISPLYSASSLIVT